MRQQNRQRQGSSSGCDPHHPEAAPAAASGNGADRPPRCCFHLFGRFSAKVVPHQPGLFHQAKARELICYLLLFRDRPHHREVLCELLWPAQPAARKYLRQALWQLGTLADTEAGAGPPVLLVDADWVHLNPAADIWLDVAHLEDPFAGLRHIPGDQLDDDDTAALNEAVQVYRADLLEGWYQDWCIYERERLKAIYLAILDKLLAYCEAKGHHDDGRAYGERILRHDRAHERTHQRLMRLHYLAGDRTAAIRQFERCVAALSEELGVKPADRSVDLYEAIRADKLSGPVDDDTGAGQTGPGTGSARRHEEAARCLRKALRTLDEVKQHVENTLQTFG